MATRDKPLPYAATAVHEFARVDLGDARLNQRLLSSVALLAQGPALSYPDAMPLDRDLEGWYRFLSNDRVTPDALLDPHIQQTWARCKDRKVVLALADSTAMQFGGEDSREGLGHVSAGGNGHGFMMHPTLAVAADGSREPLGVLGSKTWVRRKDGPPSPTQLQLKKRQLAPGEQPLPSERDRWWQEAERIQGACPPDVELIHVMDREADANVILAKMRAGNMRFVIRQCRDRCLAGGGEKGVADKLEALLAERTTVCTRAIRISRRGVKASAKGHRRHPARHERNAELSVSAATVVLAFSSAKRSDLPDKLSVNVVRAWEANPEEGQPPVSWTLFTSEPIDTEAQLLAIIDIYRCRWLIEEYFMALKTGCAYETRQLETFERLQKALAVAIPLAWMLMRLRSIARATPGAPATTVLTKTQLRVLTLHCNEKHPKQPFLKTPTAQNAMLAVAKMGGHIKWNGPPGWRTLTSGFFRLLELVYGYELGIRDRAG